ncbi:MAG: hypothetical protein Q9181_006395, partial [Wetmoreana brouardii]
MASTPGEATETPGSSSLPSITKSEPGTTNLPTPPISRPTSDTSSDAEGEDTKLQRPKLTQRKSSGTMIIPRDAPTEGPKQDFPPDDARAMSPRRSSEETEKMLIGARLSLE